MPKSLFIDPQQSLQPGVLHFQDIPLLSYDKTAREELAAGHFTEEQLRDIYYGMVMVREFDLMLKSVRSKSTYNGVNHVYTGPAHLYVGQEAIAVGQSFLLQPEDLIFGNHRSHGEVLAKGLRAIQSLSDEALTDIMEHTNEGAQYRVILRHYPGKTIKETALHFFLYGLVCELFNRANGFSRSLANSMHLFFAPFGIYPNNAIVGGSAGMAVGAALYKKVNRRPGVVIANTGDGSLGCGLLWESMNFAAMDQFNELWEEPYRGGLPILFNVIDNGYAMGGQTRGETMAYGNLSRMGAGVCPSQMHVERVDGFDPLAVIDAYRRKLPLLKNGSGPVLLDMLTYRTCGHSVSDRGSYRTSAELDAWIAHDCITMFADQLREAKVADAAYFVQMREQVVEKLTQVLRLAVDPAISPQLEPQKIADYLFSNQRRLKMAEGTPEVTMPYDQVSQVQVLRGMDRKTEFTYRDAVFEAILQKCYSDPTLLVYGEENRDWGGQFGVYQGLTEAMPYHRLFNAPISEAAIVASGVGYGICGGRCIIDLGFCDFMGRAGDELFNQLAKWQAMSGGNLTMPVVVRAAVGSRYGAQHSQDWSSLPAHIPGLKVVFPATPYDAKGMMNAALSGTDPVIFFESQKLYSRTEQYEAGVPEEYYEVELGKPALRRSGTDVTIVTLGSALYEAEGAADDMAARGISCEIIDLRSMVPLDPALVVKSVLKTGRMVLVSNSCVTGSHMNTICQTVTEQVFSSLKAAPIVVGAKDWITPCLDFERYFFPGRDDICAALIKVMK